MAETKKPKKETAVAAGGAEKINLRDKLGIDPKGIAGQGLDFIQQHPLQAVGTGLNAAGNLAGLFDNSKVLGQLGGTALGAAAPFLLGKIGVNPALGTLGKVNLAMAGGNLGALFDNLRAKKEQEQTMLQQSMQSQY